MQQSVVSTIIFLYIFISAALLLFNIIYMLSSGVKRRILKYRIHREAEEQRQIIENLPESMDERYRRRLYAKIKNEEELLICVEALERNLSTTEKKKLTAYMLSCRNVIFDAAKIYWKKPAMEKALFAYFISLIPPEAAEEYRRMGEILLSFLEHSTVYCRENVLQALYSLGNADALIQAFQIFQENGWHHESKLLVDGLTEFRGDKAAFARRMWNQKWDERMRTVLIRFMTRLEEDMSDLILPELTAGHYELCFSAVRYFAVHRNEKAEPALLKLLQGDGDMAAAAARTLGYYPGGKTKQALKQALHSRNWNVRRNAAESLAMMNLSKEETAQLCADEDRYAREMFRYVLEGRGEKEC